MSASLRSPALSVPIGGVRHRTGLTNRTIRFYEDKGLVAVGRDAYGRRRYDQAAIDRLIYVQQARQAGLSLVQIGELLEVAERNGTAALVSKARDYYRARLADLEAQRVALEASAMRLGIDLDPPRPKLFAL